MKLPITALLSTTGGGGGGGPAEDPHSSSSGGGSMSIRDSFRLNIRNLLLTTSNSGISNSTWNVVAAP